MALTEVTSPDVIVLDNMFMPERLTRYDRYQVAWWDESHRKCSLVTISGANGCEYITRVCRDRHNNPCLHGTQSEDAPVNVNVKYEKEARFALGVALVRTNEGRTEGRRIPLFDYTEKPLFAIWIGANSVAKQIQWSGAARVLVDGKGTIAKEDCMRTMHCGQRSRVC